MTSGGKLWPTSSPWIALLIALLALLLVLELARSAGLTSRISQLYHAVEYGLADATGLHSYQVLRDVAYREVDGQALRLDAYVPKAGVHPAVVVLHEGGWVSGSKDDWQAESRHLAAAGLAVFAVDYRLSPPGGSAKAPAAVEDVQAAVRWIRANAIGYRVDATKVGVLGGSAGGHLAMMVGATGQVGEDRADAVVSWSGDSRLALFTSGPELTYCLSFLGCTLAECWDRWQAMSPYERVDPSSAPMYLANSTNEETPLEQATDMAEKLQTVGVAHVLQIIPGNQHSRGYKQQALEPSIEFLKTHLNPPIHS